MRCSRLFIFFPLISRYPGEKLLRRLSEMVTSLWNFPKHLARYTLLPTSEEAKAGVQTPQTSFRRTLMLLFSLSILINVILIWTLISPAGCTLMPILYCWYTQISKLLSSLWLLILHQYQAPAQEAVTYKITKFHSGFHDDVTEYMGPPSDELDHRWDALYAGQYMGSSVLCVTVVNLNSWREPNS